MAVVRVRRHNCTTRVVIHYYLVNVEPEIDLMQARGRFSEMTPPMIWTMVSKGRVTYGRVERVLTKDDYALVPCE